MRLTIPRSQGKQPFYDARKSGWGDLFPHAPKNAPQVRQDANSDSIEGADIGKRRTSKKKKAETSYAALAEEVSENRKKSRRDRVRLVAQKRNQMMGEE